MEFLKEGAHKHSFTPPLYPFHLKFRGQGCRVRAYISTLPGPIMWLRNSGGSRRERNSSPPPQKKKKINKIKIK